MARLMIREVVAVEKIQRVDVTSPRKVYDYLLPHMGDLQQEELRVLLLDSQNRVMRDCLVTIGTLNGSLVSPREVFKTAIKESAASIILIHNHPSGNPKPSVDDKMVTDQMVKAGRLLDIPVIDHIIVGREGYTSFRECGLM